MLQLLSLWQFARFFPLQGRVLYTLSLSSPPKAKPSLPKSGRQLWSPKCIYTKKTMPYETLQLNVWQPCFMYGRSWLWISVQKLAILTEGIHPPPPNIPNRKMVGWYCGVFKPYKNCNIETRSRDYPTVDKSVFSPCLAETSCSSHRLASPLLLPGNSYEHLDNARVGKAHVTASTVMQQLKHFPACQTKGL
jgi:hypothetical protein